MVCTADGTLLPARDIADGHANHIDFVAAIQYYADCGL